MTMTPCFLDTGLGIVPPDWSGVEGEGQNSRRKWKKELYIRRFLTGHPTLHFIMLPNSHLGKKVLSEMFCGHYDGGGVRLA